MIFMAQLQEVPLKMHILFLTGHGQAAWILGVGQGKDATVEGGGGK